MIEAGRVALTDRPFLVEDMLTSNGGRYGLAAVMRPDGKLIVAKPASSYASGPSCSS
jgi:hypothetical protein